MNAIVIYASSTGNTKAVANYIADRIGCKAVAINDVAGIDIGSFDKVIFGSRVWAGSIDGKLSDYLDQNKSILQEKDASLFLCCLYNEDRGDKQCKSIAEKYGFQKCAYFNKGKKLAQTGEKIDDFIAGL